MAIVSTAELARLREIETAHQALVTVHGKLETAHKTLSRQFGQVFRLIAGTPQFFSRLTTIAGPANDGKSTAGTPTNDGTGWQIDYGSMTLVIVPLTDELKLIDNQSNVPTGTFKLGTDGTIDAQTQTLMLGYAERIVRAAAPEGFDPVADATNLLGQVTPA